MTYINIEMQTTAGTTAILAAAAVSAVEEHTAVMLTSDGRIVRSECYRHTQAAEE